MSGSQGDEAVQATNDDASCCKLSAVRLGYWSDPWLGLLLRKGPGQRRAPEIHLGYYARVMGLRFLMQKFLEAADTRVQVISLGAGYDTTYWRLVEEGTPLANYVELDFPGVTAKKCFLIKRQKELVAGVAAGGEEGEIRLSRTELHSTRYHLCAADLANTQEVEAKLQESGLDFSAPTLILAECVLVYINADKSEKLLQWLADKFTSAVFLNYEQLNMGDRFGQVMLDNLLSRGCVLAGVSACRDSASMSQRFSSAGWDSATTWDMNQVYSSLPQGDLQRAEAIERLDERELLSQLFHHYGVTVARKNSANFNFDSVNFD